MDGDPDGIGFLRACVRRLGLTNLNVLTAASLRLLRFALSRVPHFLGVSAVPHNSDGIPCGNVKDAIVSSQSLITVEIPCWTSIGVVLLVVCRKRGRTPRMR